MAVLYIVAMLHCQVRPVNSRAGDLGIGDEEDCEKKQE